MFRPLFILLFGLSTVSSVEIEVAIPTHAKRLPIEIEPIEMKNTKLDERYLQQLTHILSFDFHQNGKTYLIDSRSKKKMLVTRAKFEVLPSKKMNSFVALKPQVQGRTLFITFQKNRDAKQHTVKAELSGDLAKDRQTLHRVHDRIFKTLFQKEGIATGKIAFVKKLANKTHPLGYQSEIWMCDWDGENAEKLTQSAQFYISPKFVPSEMRLKPTHFLSVSYHTGQPKIHLGAIGNAKTHPIINLRGNQLLPAISKQKDKIAFISDAAGRPDLFLVNYYPGEKRFGKPKQLVSYPGSTTASPTFSPDGSQIAFVSDKSGTPRIYVVNANKKGRQPAYLITKKNLENTCPDWSPDGKRLVYVAKVGGIRQLWLYDFATRKETQLTSDPMNKENPSWAADNMHIVFNSVDKKNTQIYILHVNQPVPVQITFGPGEKKYPTFEVWEH